MSKVIDMSNSQSGFEKHPDDNEFSVTVYDVTSDESGPVQIVQFYKRFVTQQDALESVRDWIVSGGLTHAVKKVRVDVYVGGAVDDPLHVETWELKTTITGIVRKCDDDNADGTFAVRVMDTENNFVGYASRYNDLCESIIDAKILVGIYAAREFTNDLNPTDIGADRKFEFVRI